MKRFTILFIVLLAAAVGGALVYVGASPDFAEPARLPVQDIPADNPIWSKTIDDLAEYLIEKGVILTTEHNGLSGGIANEAVIYGGVELYWWDLENLEEGSDEYIAYESAIENGCIDLWGSGNLMVIVGVRGPFALNVTTRYEGDVKALEEAFRSYCAENE